MFQNILHVWKILLVFPASNALVDRGFSAMGQVKGSDRNRLGAEMVDDLLRISIDGDGPAMKDFDSSNRRRRLPDVTGDVFEPSTSVCR